MDTKQRLKLVGYYRLLSWVSFSLGLAFVGLGMYLGLGETVTILLREFPAEFDAAIQAANPTVSVALSMVGVVVWQLGKSYALTKTMEKAVVAESSDGSDQQLKSEVLDVVNDQLSSVESDLRSEISRLDGELDDDGLSVGTTTASSSGGGRSSTSSRSDASGSSGRTGQSGSRTRTSTTSTSTAGGPSNGGESSPSDGDSSDEDEPLR